ncbi:MAG: hypothetical protein Q8R82_19640 [Hyphomonadaceae bacterium]|nr:hypothetical protein [Hyphomonadaceae bacterium]
MAGAIFIATDPFADAQPVKVTCSATFTLSNLLGSFGYGELKDGVIDRLYVEMGPSRVAMTTKGAGVSGAYKAKTPDLMFWSYMSVYQPTKEWLTPGSVRLDYSGFRLSWPVFTSGGKPVKALKLTVTQGDQTMTVDVPSSAKVDQATNRVFAIDFEAMLAGRYPTLRVGDHQKWRSASQKGEPVSVTLTDAGNGKVVARGTAPLLQTDTLQDLLSGALNGVRDAYKNGKCS